MTALVERDDIRGDTGVVLVGDLTDRSSAISSMVTMSAKPPYSSTTSAISSCSAPRRSTSSGSGSDSGTRTAGCSLVAVGTPTPVPGSKVHPQHTPAPTAFDEVDPALGFGRGCSVGPASGPPVADGGPDGPGFLV